MKDSAKTFTHYIAKSQRQAFLHTFATVHFYSFLMDGSTDAGNVADELIAILYCLKDDEAQEVRSCIRFLSVQVPTRADAGGLIRCLCSAMEEVGLGNFLDRVSVLGVQGKPIVVGGGTDGATVNIGQHRGMKGTMQEALPWLFWTWCYSHRLELACKDALSSRLFKDIDEMLLRLYLIYAKSPKKSRELSDLVSDLKEVFELPNGGDFPVRSQGSRWISHKRSALQQFVDHYGAYIHHLAALVEDQSLRADDRARLKGYLHTWKQCRMLIGSALYVDLLKPASLLSLSLQGEKLDIVHGLQAVLKSGKSLKSMAGKDPLQWPTVKLVCSRVKEDDGGKVYQGATLHHYTSDIVKFCAEQARKDSRRLEEKMKERLEWSDAKLLRAILVMLDTQSWQCTARRSFEDDEEEDEHGLTELKSAVEYIITKFREPLEAKGVALAGIQDELEEVVHYARKYLSLDRDGYHKIWYKTPHGFRF